MRCEAFLSRHVSMPQHYYAVGVTFGYMARYVTEEVQALMEPDSTPAQTEGNVALAVVPGEESTPEEVTEQTNTHDGTVDRVLPSEVVLVEVPISNLEAFCEAPFASVSETDRMRVLC
jgi:hypothetical protein